MIRQFAKVIPNYALGVRSRLIEMGIDKNLKLIDYAFNSDYNKEFEKFTCQLLKSQGGYNAKIQAKIPGPDITIEEGTVGVIVDNKSSNNQFSLKRNNINQMVGYLDDLKLKEINNTPEWTDVFNNKFKSFQFIFITNSYNKNTSKIIEEIKLKSKFKGNLITAEDLLIMLDGIEKKGYTKETLIDYIKQDMNILLFKPIKDSA